MDFSKLSYAQVQAMADRLNTSANSMEALLGEIKALFEKIGNDEVWSGTAAAQTKEQFELLSAKFPEFSNAAFSMKPNTISNSLVKSNYGYHIIRIDIFINGFLHLREINYMKFNVRLINF